MPILIPPVKFSYVGSGAVALSGSSARSGTGVTYPFSYVASGGLSLSGGVEQPSSGGEVEFELDWNVSQPTNWNQAFTWNTGKPIMYAYQVNSCCRNTQSANTCPPFDTNQNCPQNYILTIIAPNLANVCQQLMKRGLTAKVCDIGKFTLPWKKSDIARLKAQGLDTSCNALTPQAFCDLPECQELCLDHDVQESWNADIFNNNSMTANSSSSGGSGSSGSGGVTMGGAAVVLSTSNLFTPHI